MKSLVFTLAFAIAVSLTTMPVAQAQSATGIKVAVVDVRLVFEQLPQSRDIAKTIEMEFQERAERLRTMETSMTALQERLQRDEAIMTEQELQEAAMQLQQQYQEYQERREALSEQLNRRRNEERNRVLGQIQQVVNDIADSEGYDLVLEAGNIAFAKPGLNITNRVIERMSRD
ncbi:OmpH family outer membrane protein [Aliidiomarina quisquiliarum]|uniref:OmpH family outer membrane protein n=1 Tax=Aliidiomarina quisquiliarum TaxID=2938947 RepID=UPI00208F03A2|nr:OmpH family outer membrane protein [Aliidiomarina quisquiliarum]MCO4320452.1 OmpH family outer membrane protein [Aliidiomarina quisquiliarum]